MNSAFSPLPSSAYQGPLCVFTSRKTASPYNLNSYSHFIKEQTHHMLRLASRVSQAQEERGSSGPVAPGTADTQLVCVLRTTRAGESHGCPTPPARAEHPRLPSAWAGRPAPLVDVCCLRKPSGPQL